MLAKELITDSIPPLKVTDTPEQALSWMNEFHVTHLPVIKEKHLLGMISEEDILDDPNPKQNLADHELSLTQVAVPMDEHIYEVIKKVAKLKLSVLPVIDEDEYYFGVITLENIIHRMAEMSAFKEPGGIITLEMDLHNYSLSEIARIVETNDAQVLSSYIETKKDEKQIEVTLKINKTEIKHIIATFERFNYEVKYSFKAETIQDVLKDRYDSLMRYLEM